MKIQENTMRGLDPRCHGVNQFENSTAFIESIRRKGWYVLPSQIPESQVLKAKSLLYKIYEEQKAAFPVSKIFDENVVRAPFSHDSFFFKFIFDEQVITHVEECLGPNYILMLQNAPLNQPNNAHQGYSWHRDLVWQHFTSSKPLSLTVTYALDDYTELNGGFQVLNGSHMFSDFPSHNYAESNAERVTVKAGSIIIFDSMLFHRAGINKSNHSRNLIVQLYTLPLIKQQICIPTMLGNINLTKKEKMILGYGSEPASNVLDWREKRLSRIEV